MISARNLTVSFRRGLGRAKLKALDDVTLDIGEGEFFALLGQNGAGKSTAMSCVLGLLRPTSGSVTVLGKEPRPGSEAFREIAYLPEEPTYHGYLTVVEAVTYYGRLGGASYSAARRDELLERFGLAPFREMRVDKCSKGMKQKVGIVQCLLNEPRLLLLDEPMRGLDPVAVKDFRELLVDLHSKGVTVVMNSHILAEVQQVATRVAILDRGRLLKVDSVANLRSLGVDSYEFEIEARAPLPGYVTGLQATNGHIRGVVPAEQLWEFLAFCRDGGGELASCARKQASLEESYFAIVGREHLDA
jgi:ABC-type multidrug transport system ATPase subunit